MKSIYNSDIRLADAIEARTGAYQLQTSLRDPEFLAALLCTALCKKYPFSLNDPAMCKLTPDFYADVMDAEAHRLEDAIMIAYCKSVDSVRAQLGLPALPDADETAVSDNTR